MSEPIDRQTLDEPDLNPNLDPADSSLSVGSPPPVSSEEVVTLQSAIPRGIAPVWHTLIILIAILSYSIWGAIGARTGTANPLAPPGGAIHADANGVDHMRLIRYGLSGALELGIVAWVAFGLRLRRVPFRSLFGSLPKSLNDITIEFLIAAAFWVCSMVVLSVCALGWLAVQEQVFQHETAQQSPGSPASKSSSATQSKSGKPAVSTPKAGKDKLKSPEQQQKELIQQLMELAPGNGIEIAAWALLCIVVGFSEELIFRGYMQSQSIALLRNVPVGVIFTAVIFGAAHGYQGLRGIFLISVYGLLFGAITLLRKSLLPGMIAHSWHDFATGMALALIRSSHLLEHLPSVSK